ncbi:MAG TPA: LuxR C-terminal-related transcriptional regulator [Gemmatimonadaceae bacterium]|nr:LuxR C-terminal-related transcriptional regulator [Gemmatimonadaceae bacterium]
MADGDAASPVIVAHAESLDLAMPANHSRAPRPPRTGNVGTVGLVGCRPQVHHRVAALVGSRGYALVSYESAAALLHALDSLRTNEPDVLLVDLDDGADDGTRLLDVLREGAYATSTILMSGHSDIPAIVRAIRAGAVDFLERGCDDDALAASLTRAMDITRRARELHTVDDEARMRWHTLSPREVQVCRLVVQGRLNKQIAAALGTSEKTVKVHRAHAMTKMGAHSLAELVHMIDRLGDGVALADAPPAPPPPSPIEEVNRPDAPPAPPR